MTRWLLMVTFQLDAPTPEAALERVRQAVRDPALPITNISLSEIPRTWEEIEGA